MDRIDFIKKLADELSYEVKPSEIHQLINYYDEMIQDLMEDGYSEQEAVAKLGDPKQLAKEAAGISNQAIEIDVPRRWNPFIIILLILGFPLWGSLLVAALALLFSAYLVIWCIPFTTGIFGASAAFAGIISALFSPRVMSDALFYGLTQLGMGTLFFGLGILSLLLTWQISGHFLSITRNVSAFVFRQLSPLRKQVMSHEN